MILRNVTQGRNARSDPLFVGGTSRLVTKTNGDRAKAEGTWARSHLAALVQRRVEPESATGKAKQSRAAKKPKAEVVRALHQARSMGGG